MNRFIKLETQKMWFVIFLIIAKLSFTFEKIDKNEMAFFVCDEQWVKKGMLLFLRCVNSSHLHIHSFVDVDNQWNMGEHMNIIINIAHCSSKIQYNGLYFLDICFIISKNSTVQFCINTMSWYVNMVVLGHFRNIF